MVTRSSQKPLTGEIARFQRSIRTLALEVVASIVREEFKARIDHLKASLAAPARSRRRARGAARIAPPNAPKVVDAVARMPPTVAGADAKRRWTRDAIIKELAMWLASGTTIDASFVTRHGPRGLVAACKREFGRFEAALNVASLRVSKFYPDKPSRSPR
jgi:hypothetical protein